MKKLSIKDLQLNPISIAKGKDPIQSNDSQEVPKTFDINDHESCMQCIATIGVDCETKASFCQCESYECTVDCESDGCGTAVSEGCNVNLTVSCNCDDNETVYCNDNTYACKTNECNTNDPCNLSDAYCGESRGEYVCESIELCVLTDDGCDILTDENCNLLSEDNADSCLHGCEMKTDNNCHISLNVNCFITNECDE